MILVIGPDSAARDAVCKTIQWVDRRIRIHTVDNAAQGWEFVSRKKPGLIVFDPGLSDIEDFLRGVRRAAPAAFLVSSGDPARAEVKELADGILPEPPCRITMLSFIKQMKNKALHRRKVQLHEESGNGNGNGSHKSARESLPHIAAFSKINVSVAIDTTDSRLKFNVPATRRMPLGAFLSILGKHQVTWYCLYRNGKEIEADLNMQLEDGDFLLLRASESTAAPPPPGQCENVKRLPA